MQAARFCCFFSDSMLPGQHCAYAPVLIYACVQHCAEHCIVCRGIICSTVRCVMDCCADHAEVNDGKLRGSHDGRWWPGTHCVPVRPSRGAPHQQSTCRRYMTVLCMVHIFFGHMLRALQIISCAGTGALDLSERVRFAFYVCLTWSRFMAP